MPVWVNDPQEQCAKPIKPAPPYTDKAVAVLIIEQDHAIEKCRMLLGHE
jgi:hypothetical protein